MILEDNFCPIYKQKRIDMGFDKKWKDGIDTALKDDRWNDYDCDIMKIVGEYNLHLANTPSYRPLDWKIVKAMIWTETGANSKYWNKNPMQIGNPGDPGLADLLSSKNGGELILPIHIKNILNISNVASDSKLNLYAGTGYLLKRFAHFKFITQKDNKSPIEEVIVKQGDNFEKIAKIHGTTIDVLKELNPSAQQLNIGQKLTF